MKLNGCTVERWTWMVEQSRHEYITLDTWYKYVHKLFDVDVDVDIFWSECFKKSIY